MVKGIAKVRVKWCWIGHDLENRWIGHDLENFTFHTGPVVTKRNVKVHAIKGTKTVACVARYTNGAARIRGGMSPIPS